MTKYLVVIVVLMMGCNAPANDEVRIDPRALNLTVTTIPDDYVMTYDIDTGGFKWVPITTTITEAFGSAWDVDDYDGLLEVAKTGVAILNDDGEVVFIDEYDAEQIIAANKTTTTICPNSSVELTGEIVDMGIDYSQITIDTSRILSICFDDRMHCYNTMQLKDYVAYKKEDK